ncbi:FecCD family ABC transporter permease [Paenibacillus arenilitoris]|uniref:Iron ABC transporter permease n=1 Tax=Paenibacillus arenilitoris TaxID=2772299 RepID=A0A927CSN6_9BACL|nr:iron ABC transporter permease [Paenibacillus arenilitoris]MBD2871506.1 iron ABC transporter permease [Paenibacillus arenilitoris]
MNGIYVSAVEQRRRRRAVLVMTTLAVLIIVSFIISMNTGFIRLSPLDVVKTLFGMGTEKQELILFSFRLPRIVISVLIGAGFAVSGCIIQGLSRNPLADPGLLGINAGAGLAVVLFVSFYPASEKGSIFLMPLLALVGAALTALLIYVLSYRRHHGFMPTRMILAGIAVAAGISAAMIILTIRLDPTQYQFVSVWLAGSIWGTNWKYVLALLPWLIVLLPFVFYKAKALNALNLGEQLAVGLGTRVNKERAWLLAAAVGLAASSVAVGGGIGFVGLIAPHLARRLVGPHHQVLLPASAFVGALLVIVADTLARWAFQPSEIPTGIVVAVIGAPYFLYLLSRSK